MKKQIIFTALALVLFAAGCASVGPVASTSPAQTAVVGRETKGTAKQAPSETGQKKIKVLYAGDSGAVLGPHIIASPLNYESKGFEVHIWCQQVLDALNGQPDIEVRYMTTWEAAINTGPGACGSFTCIDRQ